MSRFVIGERDFLLDDKPMRILSGALHYFRVHPDAWADRIAMAKAMGLNTIETYVPWNLHAPVRGEFVQTGALDLGRFLDEVHAAGMHAIVRPGPYICAEHDGGGLPGWLFADPDVGVRRAEPKYLAAVYEFLVHVYAIVAPRQIDEGGNVILVQIENEYGAYGSDKVYLRHLVDVTRGAGITVPFITIDQPGDLADGSLPEHAHLTASFGSRATERLEILRRHQPTGPLMCTEFWIGWFDWWGSNHHTTSAANAAAELDELLSLGASVNIYMFHGGTNFGFSNGANDKGLYLPTVTSYDYDAPLDETGRPTEKFWAFREVIAKYAQVPSQVPEPQPLGDAVSAVFDRSVPLFDLVAQLGPTSQATSVPTSDSVAHYNGFSTYGVQLPARDATSVLTFTEVRDRAQFFLDGVPIGVLSRENNDTTLTIAPGPAGRLNALVEDQGRVNYEVRLGEHKGLIGPALLDGVELSDWQITAIDVDLAPGLIAQRPLPQTAPIRGGGPVFLSATLRGAQVGLDLFVSTTGLSKGNVWVNGFNLGRFWSRGPTHTLLVPGQLLVAGDNQVVILELNGTANQRVELVSQPDLGHTEL